jgi:diguanylate cyclase (GGDEF)-like protein
VAERVRQRVAAGALQTHGVHFNVTASVGFAAATASMSGFEALLHAADQALYQAKAEGRNRTVAWAPPPEAKLAAE